MSKAASFSRVGLYEKCPASYEWQYVLGNKRPFNPVGAAARGTEIHDSIEKFFLEGGDWHPEIPEVVREWILEDHVDGCTVHPEMEFALTKDWGVTDFEAEDAYVRGLMDNVFITENCVIHEYKTGQMYDDHAEQKALYAMVALILFPNLQEVTVKGIYIDKKKMLPSTYSRKQLIAMQFQWKRRIDRLHLPLYPARPGQHCRWCPKSKKQDGPCQLG